MKSPQIHHTVITIIIIIIINKQAGKMFVILKFLFIWSAILIVLH